MREDGTVLWLGIFVPNPDTAARLRELRRWMSPGLRFVSCKEVHTACPRGLQLHSHGCWHLL